MREATTGERPQNVSIIVLMSLPAGYSFGMFPAEFASSFTSRDAILKGEEAV